MTDATQGVPTLTELDHVRLRALMRRAGVPPAVHDLIDAADLVPSRAVRPDVVTMYSRLRLRDADGGQRMLAVCWPPDAEPEAGYVSVLSPLGAALLGRSVGERVRWPTPDGRWHEAEIAAVLFQPEASGDYTT